MGDVPRRAGGGQRAYAVVVYVMALWHSAARRIFGGKKSVTYEVGIDLGTTYTAAAVHRDGRSAIFPLGSRAAAIPSVVYLKEGGEVLTGEAAVRRAITEPERVAREFKRRLGDTTPIIVGGTPYSSEALMARVLKGVLEQIETREGSAPSRIAISHPANWGEYKLDLLKQAIRLAEVDDDKVHLLTEPEAAALSYASQERIEPGEVIAVYDLGGGTFDAAVLRRTAQGFEIIGKPEGIERLGGIDFDAAVAAHVARSLDGALDDLDDDDPAAMAAMSRLRQDCVDAKEALSSDTDATIPVLLPSLQTDVRITRTEFEALIRPSLVDSIGAMHRAVKSAGVEWTDVSKVLLIGGSSRVPLISQMVASELGRPVAVDAHPKHAVALGAAFAASKEGLSAAAAPTTPAPAPAPAAAPVAPVKPAPAPAPAPTPTPEPVVQAPPVEPVTPAPVPAVTPPLDPPAKTPVSASPPSRPAPTPKPEPITTPSADSSAGSRLPLIGALVAVLAVVGIGAFVVLNGGGDEDPEAATETTVEAAGDDEGDTPDVTAEDATTTTAEATTTTTAAPPNDEEMLTSLLGVIDPTFSTVTGTVDDAGVVTLTGRAFDEDEAAAVLAAADMPGVTDIVNEMEIQAEDERCTANVQAQPNFGCITSAFWDGTNIQASYFSSADFGGPALSVGSGLHLHLYASSFEPTQVGTAGPFSDGSGSWQVYDTPEQITVSLGQLGVAEVPEKLCALIANQVHTIESLNSGTCWPIVDLTLEPTE